MRHYEDGISPIFKMPPDKSSFVTNIHNNQYYPGCFSSVILPMLYIVVAKTKL
jgi:hypothetical protein